MKLSIIIPVYNIAAYLDEAVQSVREQSFTNWEIILVDDGSTDNSPVLCDQWVERDDRIKVIHKANGGLSDARNVGLMQATGDYIHFLDGDDYYASAEVLQILMRAVEELGSPDSLLFCRQDYYEDTGKMNHERLYQTEWINGAESPTAAFEHLLKTQRFNMSACFQLLRRSLLIENQLFFEKGLLSEDVDWSILLWQHLRSVKAINCEGYCYRHRSASISTTLSIRTYKSYHYMFQKWLPQLQAIKTPLTQLQLNYLAFLFPTLLYGFYLIPKRERKEAYQLLKGMKSVLAYSSTRKSNRVVLGIKCMGFWMACRIFASYGCISKKGLKAYWKAITGK